MDDFLLRFPTITQARFFYEDLKSMREWWNLLLPVLGLAALWVYRREREQVHYEKLGQQLFQQLLEEERIELEQSAARHAQAAAQQAQADALHAARHAQAAAQQGVG
ncbi:MAG: hypothetical protein HC911_15265 [Chloroflexaceae bacterium]|nr:hypothetical protein [Chloroflexaceae bacterium]